MDVLLDKYLLSLVKIVNEFWDGKKSITNLTNFSDIEFLKKARYFLAKTRTNFIKSHMFKPHVLIKYYFKRAYVFYQYEGINGLIKEIKDYILSILQIHK